MCYYGIKSCACFLYIFFLYSLIVACAYVSAFRLPHSSSSLSVSRRILTVWYTCIVCMCTILFVHETIGFTPHTSNAYKLLIPFAWHYSHVFLCQRTDMSYGCCCVWRFCYVASYEWWVWVHTIRSVKLANISVCAKYRYFFRLQQIFFVLIRFSNVARRSSIRLFR